MRKTSGKVVITFADCQMHILENNKRRIRGFKKLKLKIR